MTANHLELILEILPGADRDKLQSDLRAQGFDPLPMKIGILLAGDLDALRKVVPTLSGVDEVTVPDNLKHVVRAIHVVKPRRLHSP